MATSQQRIDELAKQLSNRMGLKKELKTLVEVLEPNEDVIALADGQYEGKRGIVVASDRRIIFYQRGLTRGKQEDFRYPKITSVQNDSGMVSTKIKIVVSGASATIKMYDKKVAQGFVDVVRARLHGDSQEGPQGTAPAAATTNEGLSPKARLERLEGLREAGVITEAEYEESRAAIIAEL